MSEQKRQTSSSYKDSWLGCDRYRVKRLLGKKTGRRTFLAHDRQTNQRVVVKLVLFGPDFTWQDLRLFEREAQTLQSLQHSAIPRYLDSFEVDTPLGKGFALVQTYIEAKSLQQWVSSGHTFSENELRAIATSLLSILKYLHGRTPPIIHRDIKPSNILLPTLKSLASGGVYLIDFGSVQTAPSTDTMTVVGTYGYMPPEQFGGRAKPASDLYSLGATLIYLATGQHPAELTNDSLQIKFETPSNLTASFAQWIQHLTQADLSKRIRTVDEARKLLLQSTKTLQPEQTKRTIRNEANRAALSSQATHKDLKVLASYNQIEIQFSIGRLNSNLPSGGIELVGLFALTIIVIPLALITHAWVLFLLIWCAVCILMMDAYDTKHKKRGPKLAYLRLTMTDDGSIWMSLSTKFQLDKHQEREVIVHNVPMGLVKTNRQKNQLAFSYQSPHTSLVTGSSDREVAIHGSVEDIQWLLNAVNQWDDTGREKVRERVK